VTSVSDSALRRGDQLRAELVRATPRWYRPWAHLLFPSLFGLGVVAAALASLRALAAWELAVVPITCILANAVEWHAHKGLLHTRRRWAPVLYDRHTPIHHVVFVRQDMAIRDFRELRLVLLPSFAIGLLFLATVPVALALALALSRNAGALYLATSMAYVLSYEWLHLAYHLPAETWLGRRRLIAALRRHHALHHDPRLMQRWNFNVTVPLWDWVRGTSRASS
jgi:hypothetical protein